MAYEFATYEKQGRIAVVTINRPERMNSLHPPANFELHEIWNDFERDPDLWVGIVTGTGDKAFSAGNDLRFTAEHGRDMVRMAESGFGGLANRTTNWKPIIAAVNGYALVGGFEMALACDIIVAADSARLRREAQAKLEGALRCRLCLHFAPRFVLGPSYVGTNKGILGVARESHRPATRIQRRLDGADPLRLPRLWPAGPQGTGCCRHRPFAHSDHANKTAPCFQDAPRRGVPSSDHR